MFHLVESKLFFFFFQYQFFSFQFIPKLFLLFFKHPYFLIPLLLNSIPFLLNTSQLVLQFLHHFGCNFPLPFFLLINLGLNFLSFLTFGNESLMQFPYLFLFLIDYFSVLFVLSPNLSKFLLHPILLIPALPIILTPYSFVLGPSDFL